MRIFITTILPEQLISKYNLSFAACNFSFNLMSGGAFDKVYSILPLYTSGELDKKAYEDKRFELEYCTLHRKRGGKWTLLATIFEQWKIFKSIPKKSSVWTYNLNTLNAVLVLLLKIFKPSVQVNVIVLDFTPVTKGIGLNSLYLKLINSAHGNICLATSNLFKCKNRAILPGVVPMSSGNEVLISRPDNKFLLSGVLSERIAQIGMVLKAFSLLPQCELHITGIVDDEKLIKEFASKNPNIIYHGKVSFQEYMEIMHSCTFQLSTRHPDYPENLCNFPSKIIETLFHNRIIISTIDYPQLSGIKYFTIESDLQSFLHKIERISQMDNDILMDYANQGKIVAEAFSIKVWNDTMIKIENAT